VKPSISDSTWTRYEGLLRLHALPFIGHPRLGRLGPFHLEQLYTGRMKAGLSPTTVLQLHRVLHHALRDAVRWSVVPRNVSDLVTPPRRARYDFCVLSPDQAWVFLRAVEGDRLQALYVLAITTGMRQGELFGLHWADVNLRTRVAAVGSPAQDQILPQADSPTSHCGRHSQTPSRSAGSRAPTDRSGLGGQRPGVPQSGRPAHQPFQLPAARLLSTT
jgi:site-specific recombinase XerC